MSPVLSRTLQKPGADFAFKRPWLSFRLRPILDLAQASESSKQAWLR